MKKPALAMTAACVILAALVASHLLATETQATRAHEYVTIRWAGRDNTHIIRPAGQVEFAASELRKITRPDRTDERAFYMNVIMNGLTKEGYRFVGMTSDDVVMERDLK